AMKDQVIEAFQSPESSEKSYPHCTILDALSDSNLSPEEKSIGRTTEEAMVVIGAGVEALANPIAITIFELLKNPSELAKLKEELNAANPDTSAFLQYAELQHLPYLNAIVLEGMRLAKENGRFPRINPESPTRYQDYEIPPGTIMSISLKDLHLNEKIFKDAQGFRPERWLDPIASKGLHRNFLPFSRGPRVCLGRHLAMAEFFVCIGNLVRRFDMQLRGTTQQGR
ncbi:MAG: hypothetical protein Q9183_002719, partial [Haloplaca sp. 2 TL-2023]